MGSGNAKRGGVMWGGNQISDEWEKGEFLFERSGVRISGGSAVVDIFSEILK